MATRCSNCSLIWGNILKWNGRILGTGLVLLFLLFFVGEGPPPMDIEFVALATMLAGFVLAWWNGLYGGLLSLLGIAAFYALNYAAAGRFPGGWVFPLCFVPGTLCVLGWLMQRCGSEPAPRPSP